MVMCSEDVEDKHGNVTTSGRLVYCSFPDCGCDGARLCMAEKGASDKTVGGNVEGTWSGKTKRQRRAVLKLVAEVSQEKKP